MLKGVTKHPSMSKSSLLLGPCLYWATEEADWYDEGKVDPADTAKRDNGTVFHGWMDDYAKGLIRDVPTQCSDEKEQVKYMAAYQHATEWLDANVPNKKLMESEVSFELDWTNMAVRRVFPKTHRDYPKRPNCMYGTADLVFTDSEGVVSVGDWKTGETDGAEQQLLTLLYCHALHYSPSSGRYRTYCLQANEFGVWVTVNEYNLEDLHNHIAKLKVAWDKRHTKHLPVFGMHCTKQYCPALAYCPKVAKETIAMADDAEPGKAPSINGVEEVTDNPLTDHQAGYTMAVVAAARRRQKYLETGVKEFIKKGGKAVYGGYEWSEGNDGYRWRKSKG